MLVTLDGIMIEASEISFDTILLPMTVRPSIKTKLVKAVHDANVWSSIDIVKMKLMGKESGLK